MDNLAFHITDITANSIRAKASQIEIETSETEHKRSIKIIDNGTGMSKEVVDQVTNPFYTTRTTRKMGFGLPFLKQNAEQAGGRVEIQSEPGKGTTVYAEFDTQNIDCPPWGNLPETIALLITGNPKVNIIYSWESPQTEFTISTADVAELVGEAIPISHPKVTLALIQLLMEAINHP